MEKGRVKVVVFGMKEVDLDYVEGQNVEDYLSAAEVVLDDKNSVALNNEKTALGAPVSEPNSIITVVPNIDNG